jgi:hypothetical protein
VARPLLEGEQLGREAEGEPVALDRPVAAASWPSSRKRNMRGGPRASVREGKGEGRVGPRGGEGRLKRARERRGKGGRWGWLGQRPSGPVRLAGPKARNE